MEKKIWASLFLTPLPGASFQPGHQAEQHAAAQMLVLVQGEFCQGRKLRCYTKKTNPVFIFVWFPASLSPALATKDTQLTVKYI